MELNQKQEQALIDMGVFRPNEELKDFLIKNFTLTSARTHTFLKFRFIRRMCDFKPILTGVLSNCSSPVAVCTLDEFQAMLEKHASPIAKEELPVEIGSTLTNELKEKDKKIEELESKVMALSFKVNSLINQFDDYVSTYVKEHSDGFVKELKLKIWNLESNLEESQKEVSVLKGQLKHKSAHLGAIMDLVKSHAVRSHRDMNYIISNYSKAKGEA